MSNFKKISSFLGQAKVSHFFGKLHKLIELCPQQGQFSQRGSCWSADESMSQLRPRSVLKPIVRKRQ